MDNKLPDTPWHMGYAKKEESDPRRHKGRCIFYTKSHCKNVRSGCFMLKCNGSSHCKYYAESANQWEDVLEKTKTIEDINREKQAENDARSKAYQKKKMLEAAALLKTDRYSFRDRRFDDLHRCPICDSKLSDGNVKFCRYCRAYFAPKDSPYQKDTRVFLVSGGGTKYS